jgi:hypothetical protein
MINNQIRRKRLNWEMKLRTEIVPQVIQRFQPNDITIEQPLQVDPLGSVQYQVLLPTTHRRLQYLPTAIDNMFALYGRELEVHVLVDRDSAEVENFHRTYGSVSIHFDKEFYFSNFLLRFPEHRRRWFHQQTLKWSFAAQFQKPTLVVDSDTFILKPINFLAHEKINLFVRRDVHWPYQHSLRRYIKLPYLNLSFVTHFQLIDSFIVREILGSSIEEGIDKWLKSSLFPQQMSCLSEYQTYGQYLFFFHPDRVRLVECSFSDHDLRLSSNLPQILEQCARLGDFVTLAREEN